ncbi:Ig-like domain-containing protein [Planctomicrobium sp. SH668]|uniref:Ig-like domain-containing protein n=1 Tax=Planctomicrobium sp. SH668 TaxID=3448126 RepID=UPI003F5B05A9
MHRFQSKTFRAILVVGAVCIPSLTGCGGPTSGVDLIPVRGKVTLNGTPVEGAMVIFTPVGKRLSSGKTNAEGEYVLTYGQGESGAVAGTHAVTITTYVEADKDSDDPIKNKGQAETIPPEYNKNTTLSANLTDRQSSRFDFPLEGSMPVTKKKRK